MKGFYQLLIAVLIFLMTVTLAFAETNQGSFSLTPMIGGYVFEGDQDMKFDTTLGVGLGYGLTDDLSVEAVFNYIGTETETTNNDVDISLYHVDLLYHLNPFERLEPFVAFGLGVIDMDADVGGSDADFMLNYGVGLKFFLSESFALRGDVRHIYAFSDGSDNNFSYTLGLSYLFGNKAKAAPVAEPAPIQTPAPAPEPTPVVAKDSDGDGVLDDHDRCPGTPAGVVVDETGCPKDSDGDGVYDYLDKCPDTPASVPVDPDGCPLDTDGDGVPDYRDKCPNTPKAATVNDRGCWIIEGLFFDTNKADIKPVFSPKLDALVDVLNNNALMKLEIAGHTDNIGTQSYNQVLSEKRAAAVMHYLVDKGIDQDRLVSKGYNFSKPVASNDTAEGRSKNRRVELKPLR